MQYIQRRNARFDAFVLTDELATIVHRTPDLWGHWADLARRLQKAPTLQHYTYDQLHNYLLKQHKTIRDNVFAKSKALEEELRRPDEHGKRYRAVLAALQEILHNDPSMWSKVHKLAVAVHRAGALPESTEEQVRRFLHNHRHTLHEELERKGLHLCGTAAVGHITSSGTGTNIWQATVELMGLDIADGAFRGSKQDWGPADDIAAAAEFRKQLRNYCRLPSRVCCVCAQRHAQPDMHPDSPFPYSHICLQLEALRTDIMSTPTVPRNGNTRWTHDGIEYHVLAESWAGAVEQPDSSEPLLHICRECVQALNTNADLERQVPRRALARCDVGLPPPWYQPLTLAEALLVAPLRAVRHMVLLSNPAIWRPSEQRQKALHGHCVTFLAPGPVRMLSFIPRRIADLPEQLHVALVGIAGTEAEAREQARRQSQRGQHPLHVNGQKVARWIWHIFMNCLKCAGDWGSLGVDESAVQELREFSGLPESLLSSATVVAPGASAEAVLQALRSDPVGYAQTRFNADPEEAHRQMGAPVPDATGSSPVPAAVQAMVQVQAMTAQLNSPQPSPAHVERPDVVISDLTAMAAAVEERAASVLQAAVHPLHSAVRDLRHQTAASSSRTVAATSPRKRTLYDHDSIRANIRTALQGPNASIVRMHLAAHKWKDLAYYIQPPHGVDRQQLWRHFQRLGTVEYTSVLDEQPQPAPHAAPSIGHDATLAATSTGGATMATSQTSLPLHSARRAPVPPRKTAWTIHTETAKGQANNPPAVHPSPADAAPTSTAPQRLSDAGVCASSTAATPLTPGTGASPESAWHLEELDFICDLLPRMDPATARVQAASRGDIFGRIADGDTLVVSHGSRKADDYNWGYHLLSHPEAFYNGTGFRPEGMGEEVWVALLLNRARPPDVPENPFLTADLLNVLQRHQVNRWADIKMRLDAAGLRRISRMTAAELQQAVDILKSGLWGPPLAHRLAAASPAVRELFHAFKFVSGHVIGSQHTLAQARMRHLGGSWLTFGLLALFITFSPSPQHAQLVFELMGRRFTFNLDGSPNRDPNLPGGSQPSFDERLRLIAQNPSACSDFFQAFVAAFTHVFLGWPLGARKQVDPDCLVGRVSCWFAKMENSQAGDLHAHCCIWQPAMDVARVQRMLEDPAATAKLFAFMESVQRQWLPEPGMVAPSVGITAYDPQLPPIQVAARPKDDMACEWEPNLADPTAARRTAAEATCEREVHIHTFTCAKHGGKATHCNCRLRMPRPECKETVAYSTGLVRLRRCGAMMVPHLGPLLLAQPCNNMAYFAIEASRWAREVLLYLATHPGANPDDPHLQPPNLEETVADIAEYGVAYGTKPDLVDSSVLLTETLQQLEEREQQRKHAPSTSLPVADPAADRGKWMVAHASCVAHGAQTLPLAMASHLASGGSYIVESHRYKVHDLRVFQHLLLPTEATDPADVPCFTPQFAIHPPPPPAAVPSPSIAGGGDGGAASDVSSDDTKSLAGSDQEAASNPDADDAAAAVGPAAGSDTGDRALDVTQLDPQTQLCAVSATDDYVWRGAELAPYSPVLVTMWFKKAKLTQAQRDSIAAAAEAPSTSTAPPTPAGMLRLHPSHPQYDTHRWLQHRDPFIIQPISEPPLHPAAGSASEDREAYAAWAVGNFGTYSADKDGQLDISPPFWPHLERLMDPADASLPAIITRRFLANAQSRAATRVRGDARREALATDTPAQGSAEEALAKLVPEIHFGLLDGDAAAPVHSETDADEDAAILAQQAEELMDDAEQQLVQAADAAVPDTVASAADSPLSPDAQRRVQAAFYSAPPARRPYLTAALHCVPPLQPRITTPPTPLPPTIAPPGIPAAPAVLPAVPDAQLAAITQQQALYRNAMERTPDEVNEALMAAAGGGSDAAVVNSALHLMRPNGGHVQAVLTTVAANGIRNQRLFPTGVLPPYVLLPWDERPSPEDAAALFTLSADQMDSFMLLAHTLLAELRGSRRPPLGMLVTGDAGCGKTRIVLAFLWFAFQHRGSRLVLVTSYMWRAAMHITTPSNIAVSTTTLFALGISRRKAGRREMTQAALAAVRDRTRDVRFILFDEYGVLGRAHWAKVCQHARAVSRLMYPGEDLPDMPAGHFHIALFGDVRQHVGPKALPMLAAAPEPLVVHVRNEHGLERALHLSLGHQGSQWLAKLQQVFYLQRQHRRDDTQAAGSQLHDVAHLFDGLGKGTQQEVSAAIDRLNTRAVRDLSGLQSPRVVVLRHDVQLYLNRRLAEREALRLGQPIFIWRSVDTPVPAAPVPMDLAQHLESLPYDRTAHIPTIGIFFQGIVYCFVDSQAPALHRITNNSAVGVSLVPHDLEPPLPSTPGLHLLRYVPKAIVVQPEGPPLGDVCSVEAAGVPVVPKGCILLSCQTRRFTTTFKGASLSLLRTGLMLGDGYAVTDFASQGGNFGLQDWLAHLNPPDKGPISRATLFVILTRFRDWEALKLLAPLWRDGDAIGREAVHARFTPLAAKDPPLAAELQRLTAAAERQRAVTPAQISAAKAAAAAAAPLPEITAVLPADAAPK